MANSFDFKKIKKKYFNVGLPDGTKLQLRTPSKRIYEDLKKISTDADSNLMEQAGEVSDICAKIMSNNLENKTITEKYVSDNFDIQDLALFLESYFDYTQEVINNPN